MIEKFEIQGYWYLPYNPENRVAGILYYCPNETIRLELIGSFESPTEYLLSERNDKPDNTTIIHGESSNARQITLVNCSAYGSLNFSCSFPMQKFTAQFVLSGIYVGDFKEKLFNSIAVELPNLTSWVNNYRLSYSIPYKDEKRHGFNLGYDLDKSNAITVEIDDNTNLEIEYLCSPPSTLYEEVLHIKQFYLLKFKSKSNLSFFELLRLTDKFCDFLSLAILHPVDYNSINLFSPSAYQELTSGRMIYHPIQLYYAQDSVPKKEVSSAKYLFNYDKVSLGFEKILKTWYGFDQNMAPILQHLVDSIQPKTSFSKADFLIVIQALEGFHTRFRTKSKVDLKDRLKSLHDEFSYVPSIMGINLDYKIAADSRHYYSHFFHRNRKEHIADGIELFHLTKNLKVILICCILNEAGFDKETIALIVNGNRQVL